MTMATTIHDERVMEYGDEVASYEIPSDDSLFGWTDEAVDVETFCREYELPQIVKVDGGDYGNFGTGTHVDVARPFLLYRRRSCSKVLAASVYWEDTRQAYTEVGPRLVIPVNFKGWFYFLQDFAKVGNTWKSVKEVAEARATKVVMLKAMKCYRSSEPMMMGVQRIYSQQELPAGTVLTVGDVYTESPNKSGPACCLAWMFNGRGGCRKRAEEVRYLQCRDSEDNELLLEFNQLGEFSPVGDVDNLTEQSVYRLSDVVRCVELPLYMKLAHGQQPTTPCSFTGLLRLEELYHEDTVIACSMGTSNQQMVEFPTDSGIHFICATKAPGLMHYEFVKRAFDYCETKLDSYMTMMKVVQNFYPDHIKGEDRVITASTVHQRSLPPLPEPVLDDTSTIAESVDTMTEDFTDTEPSNDEFEDALDARLETGSAPELDDDPNYEVIPGELVKSLGALKMERERQSVSSVRLEPSIEDITDDDGYLRPRNTYSRPTNNASIDRLDRIVPVSTSTSLACTTSSGSIHHSYSSTILANDDSCISTVDGDLYQLDNTAESISMMIEGLNDDLRMLRSMQHMDKSQELDTEYSSEEDAARKTSNASNNASVSINDISSSSKPSITDTPLPPVPPPPPDDDIPYAIAPHPDLETREDVNAYLDKLFDYDAMDIEQRTIHRLLHRRYSLTEHERPQFMNYTTRGRRESDTGTTARRRQQYQYQLTNPEATLRYHNFKNMSLLKPTPKRPSLHDNFLSEPNNEFRHLNISPNRSDIQTESAFTPIQNSTPNTKGSLQRGVIPQWSYSADITTGLSHEVPSPSTSDTDPTERTNHRTDSGIFLTRWPDSAAFDSESPYMSPSEDSWTPPDDLSALSVLEVARCLRYIGMKYRVVMRFVEEQIDGKQLYDLNEELLREGFPELNALERKKVVDFCLGWRPKKL